MQSENQNQMPMATFQERNQQPAEALPEPKQVEKPRLIPRIGRPLRESQPESKSAPRISLPKPQKIGAVSTPTFTEDRKVAAELGVAAVGVISLVVLLAQLAFRRKDGRRLREPTKEEYKKVADPIGRIAARHIPTMDSTLAKDIADLSKTAGGIKEYMLSDPWNEKEGQNA